MIRPSPAFATLLAVPLLLAASRIAEGQVMVAPPLQYGPPPSVSYYYAPPVVSYYPPPVVSYYPAPAVSYYAVPAVAYYPAPVTAYYAPAISTTYYRYGLFGRRVAATTYYRP